MKNVIIGDTITGDDSISGDNLMNSSGVSLLLPLLAISLLFTGDYCRYYSLNFL